MINETFLYIPKGKLAQVLEDKKYIPEADCDLQEPWHI
jgi:hypothetical protein